MLMTLVFSSCEETQPPIYDGNPTLAYFDGTSATLEVVINTTGSSFIDVPVGVSILSSSDRTIKIAVDEENTTALPGQYSFDGTVTIPANSYTGSLRVLGNDDGLTTTGVVLSLKIDEAPSDYGVSNNFIIDIVETCPIDPNFAIGDYTLNHIGGGIPAAGFAPTMGDNIIVTLEPGSSSSERVFNVKFYPTFGFSNPPVDFSFSLVCAETSVNGIINNGITGVGCGSSIPVGPSSNLGTYNTEDDSLITIIFIEDVDGASCGTEAETTITLTKI